LDADGRTIHYVPSEALAVSRIYYVYAYGLKDLSGNLQYLSRSFTTSFAADADGPVVVATSIPDGLAGVPTNAQLTVSFDEAVNELSLAGVVLRANGDAVVVRQELSNGHRSLTLRQLQPLQPNAAHELTVSGVTDLSGNVLGVDRAVPFTTAAGADLSAPTVVSRMPVSGAVDVPLNTRIEVGFNERLNGLSVNDNSVRLYDTVTGQFVAGTPALDADGRMVTFTPSAALTANRQYIVYVTYTSYIEDLAGNRHSSTSSFRTAP
jgi:large repetitive protein